VPVLCLLAGLTNLSKAGVLARERKNKSVCAHLCTLGFYQARHAPVLCFPACLTTVSKTGVLARKRKINFLSRQIRVKS
ncbi:hypothetical protein, partial [Pseudoalteromonas luteoviolacea]|uniref:hypothetical protein n=1 Tax=Pseudoalteromonas luteoviolacea TaxID=43657 RepID=UPI001B8025D3